MWLLTVSKNSAVNLVVSTELFLDILTSIVMAGCCLLQKFWLPIPISVKRTDSVQSKRKVSSLSDRSDTSEQGGGGEVSGEESPGILSDDQPPESPSDSNDTDDTSKNMPWLKVSVYDFHKYPNLYSLLYLQLSKWNLQAKLVFGDNICKKSINFLLYSIFVGHVVAQLVEALHYKLEGRGFNSRWCHWNFSLT